MTPPKPQKKRKPRKVKQETWTDEQREYFRRDSVKLCASVLTRGSQIEQGWSDGKRHFITSGYPGALNYTSIREVDGVPVESQ